MAFSFFKKQKKIVTETNLTHLAIIMDGNGRWAKKRGLPRKAGHRAGGDKLRNVTEWCGNKGIKYLTVYAFSTENWTRPSDEVAALMELLIEFIKKYDSEMEQQGVRMRVLGDLNSVSANIRDELIEAMKRSEHRSKMQLIIAFNYGGRREILHSVQKIAQDIYDEKISPNQISEETIQNNLYLPDVPNPDLIIRPSGELRLSNFLLWEAAYSELWFSDVLWPDFSETDLDRAINDYNNRDRRFGGVKNEN